MELEIARGMSAGEQLAEAGQRMVSARKTTGGRIEAANQAAPWGGDEIGSVFAQNYLAAAAQVLEVWAAAAQRTADLGGEIVTATVRAVATDEMAHQRLTPLAEPLAEPPSPR